MMSVRNKIQENYTAIIIDETLDTKDKSFGWYYGEKFCQLRDNGVNATFVLKEKINDNVYLKSSVL